MVYGMLARYRSKSLLLFLLWILRDAVHQIHVLALSTRYRARIAYDGAGFQGFQVQGSKTRTVQLDLEQALSQRFNQPIRVVAASRTDAGVHARGQAVHFDLDRDLDVKEMAGVEHSMRKMLPQDLRMYSFQKAPPPLTKKIGGVERTVAWNVMYDSTGKLYSYRLSLGGVMHPLDRHNRWHPDVSKGSIDPEHLRHVLTHFVGTHNFRAFAGALDALERKLEQSVDAVRTVYSVDLVQESDHYFRIDFHLKGALYKQVRNMVGTALDVCQGKLREEKLVFLLNDPLSNRKDNRSKPAPPQGLTLERVYFDDDNF